jgi:hypothetical protein
MSRQTVHSLLAFVAFTNPLRPDDPSRIGRAGMEQVAGRGEVKALLEAVTRVNEGSMSIRTLNSRVVVKTPGIESVVAKGFKVIPLLAEAMKDKHLSFDAFTRCYSTCDQILRAIDPSIHVQWTGGCNAHDDAKGACRIYPRGQLDGALFREAVVADIMRHYDRVKLK